MSKPAFSKWLFDMGSQDSFADEASHGLAFSQTMGFGMYLDPRTQDKSLFPMGLSFCQIQYLLRLIILTPRPDKCRRNQSVMFQVEEVTIANHLAYLK